jgi:hypothetical protein
MGSTLGIPVFADFHVFVFFFSSSLVMILEVEVPHLVQLKGLLNEIENPGLVYTHLAFIIFAPTSEIEKASEIVKLLNLKL